MDTEEQRLKDIYQSRVRSEAPASRDQCPPPEMLLRLLRSRLSGSKAARVIDHVSHCGYCAGELKFLLEAVRREGTLVQAAESDARALSASRSGERDSRDSGAFIRRLSWGTIALIAALMIISLAVARWLVFRSAGTYRSGTEAGVKLIQPVNREVSWSPLAFTWESVEGAESYSFELFDRMLKPLWEMDGIGRSEVVLPEDAVNKLAGETEFFWMVTAHLPDGEKRTSRLEKFTLKE